MGLDLSLVSGSVIILSLFQVCLFDMHCLVSSPRAGTVSVPSRRLLHAYPTPPVRVPQWVNVINGQNTAF